MDTRSSTSVAEPGPSELSFDSKQLLFSTQPSGSSSAVRRHSAEGAVERKKTSILQRAVTLLQPEKEVGPPPTTWQSIRAIITASYLNVLLLCIPISWALNFAMPNEHTLIFVFSFLAIIPLAKLLAFATEELSLRVGQTLAGLMNATLGNAVELIVSIIALVKCELEIVQSSLIGSILSNLLLVLGMCFFAGGLRFSEQGFGMVSAQTNSSLLTISVIAVLIPSAFVRSLGDSTDINTIDSLVLKMSHGVAIILLFIYMSYLVFQLFSHKGLYTDDNKEIQQTKKYIDNPFKLKKFRRGKQATVPEYAETPLVTSPQPQAHIVVSGSGMDDAAGPESGRISPTPGEEEVEEPQLSVAVSLGLLVGVTVLVAVTAEFLVDSINGLAATGKISKEFIGVILLPIVGNAAEHVTAVTVSVKDKLTLSLGVAVGSSIQVALFVIPFIVILGWILGKPLTLLFDPLQSIVLFLSVLTVNYTVQDGKSNWLEGMILICLYLIVAVTFWFYPGATPLLSC
ncbi:Sodium/calcium exchanger protein-domain-containing protein [Boletus edulis BED1]|uniref:Sodium/calcium exchanger protein-domain-containing protein n=1 Tax=Boletus edulis BED1 TaxID=1328754 RepID=A0AAD4BUP0_BOLED|nr:Sodium/calcium exchanger protein-domain-containing protein [Boletus edulis BED1]